MTEQIHKPFHRKNLPYPNLMNEYMGRSYEELINLIKRKNQIINKLQNKIKNLEGRLNKKRSHFIF
jgi:predicted patatin/cPLA2 family phospholipase